MNIAFTFPSPFNPIMGGTERVTDVLCHEFVRRGHKVFYFHLYKAEKYQDYVPPAKVVYSDSTDYTSSIAINSYHNFLRDNAIDVVISQCGMYASSHLFTDVICEEASTPIVITTIHNDPFFSYRHFLNHVLTLRGTDIHELFKYMVKCLLYPYVKRKRLCYMKERAKFDIQHSDAILLLSERFRKDFKKLCEEDYRAEKVHAISNPLPPVSDMALSTPRKPWLLYVGRLDYDQKRPDRLLKIWNYLCMQFPDWELHIVGDGSYRTQLEKQALKLPRVYIHGWQNPTLFYQQAKILLLTSNFEGFGMVLIEAMSHGVVPILFNSYAVAPDIVDNGKCGILVPPFDVEKYVEKLSELMRDDSMRRCMAMAALEKSEVYNVENIVNQWEVLMNNIIHEKKYKC